MEFDHKNHGEMRNIFAKGVNQSVFEVLVNTFIVIVYLLLLQYVK